MSLELTQGQPLAPLTTLAAAVLFVSCSAGRLWLATGRWDDREVRARVVATVAG